MKCKHCERAATCPRGLCHFCYQNRAIRFLYPPGTRSGKYGAMGREPESLAEVEAIIAHQYAIRPKWFDKEYGKGVPVVYVPRVVKTGGGRFR